MHLAIVCQTSRAPLSISLLHLWRKLKLLYLQDHEICQNIFSVFVKWSCFSRTKIISLLTIYFLSVVLIIQEIKEHLPNVNARNCDKNSNSITFRIGLSTHKQIGNQDVPNKRRHTKKVSMLPLVPIVSIF